MHEGINLRYDVDLVFATCNVHQIRQHEPADEYGGRKQDLAFVRGEKIERPGHRTLQRSLSLWSMVGADQQSETVVEAIAQLHGGHRRHPGCG